MEVGWTAGETYDAAARVHPALKPFDDLSPFLRDLIAEWIESRDIGSDLLFAVDSALADTELSAKDVEVGTLVRLSGLGSEQPADPGDDDVGRVVECVSKRPECDRLELIRVLWPDGSIEEYCPTELEVAQPAR